VHSRCPQGLNDVHAAQNRTVCIGNSSYGYPWVSDVRPQARDCEWPAAVILRVYFTLAFNALRQHLAFQLLPLDLHLVLTQL